MDDQAGILQQRIQIAPFRHCRQQTLERVGGKQDEQQEAEGDQTQRAEYPRQHHFRQLPGEDAHAERPPRHHQHPQQQRTFMPAPHGGNAVGHGQQRIRVLRHIHHREIVGGESPGQAQERKRRQQGIGRCRRASQRNPGRMAAMGADQGQGAEQQTDQGRKDEGKMSKFRNHAQLLAFGVVSAVLAAGAASAAAFSAAFSTPRTCASFRACAASGGM